MDMKEFAVCSEEAKTKLFKTAVLYLGDPDAAAEALDEAIYKGLKACRKLKQPEYFDTWITRILINTCHDEQRRRKRHLSFEEIPEEAAEEFDSLPLKEALMSLPKELKDVILLRFFSGYTISETAEILDVPQGTAASRQRRALSLLKLELEEEVSK